MSRTTKAVLGAAAAIGVAVGAGGIASAVSTGGESDSSQEPAYTSSITVDDTAESSEADEADALAGLAKITADEARAAALAAVPGTAEEVELENENGNVVYGVEITDSSGATYDVKVDAGNGTILAQEADDAEEGDEEDDANEEAEGDDDDANEGAETDDDANEASEADAGE